MVSISLVMSKRLTHQLDSYLKQSGEPRYSTRYLETLCLLSILGLTIIASWLLKTPPWAIPVICWLGYRRGLLS